MEKEEGSLNKKQALEVAGLIEKLVMAVVETEEGEELVTTVKQLIDEGIIKGVIVRAESRMPLTQQLGRYDVWAITELRHGKQIEGYDLNITLDLRVKKQEERNG